MVEDLFSRTISQGTLDNWIEECFSNLESTEAEIRQALLASPVVHFDETGIRKMGKLHWLHAVGTERLTFYELHARRGKEAMLDMGILEHFTGWAVHDHWKSYFTLGCPHALCNAHHLRELIYLVEQEEQAWARSLIDLLLEAKAASEALPENCLAQDSVQCQAIYLRHDTLIQTGLAQNLPPPAAIGQKKKRGRPPQRSVRRKSEVAQSNRKRRICLIGCKSSKRMCWHS